MRITLLVAVMALCVLITSAKKGTKRKGGGGGHGGGGRGGRFGKPCGEDDDDGDLGRGYGGNKHGDDDGCKKGKCVDNTCQPVLKPCAGDANCKAGKSLCTFQDGENNRFCEDKRVCRWKSVDDYGVVDSHEALCGEGLICPDGNPAFCERP